MKDAGVDFVATCMDTNGVVTLAKEMKKQQPRRRRSTCPTATTTSSSTEFGDLFEGSFVRTDFTQFELPQDQPAGAEELPRPDGQARQGAVGELDRRLAQRRPVRRRASRPPGPNFSRQKLIDAINKMTDYNADGMLNGVDWTKAHTQDRSDTTFCQFFSQIKDSKFVTRVQPAGQAVRLRRDQRQLDRHRVPVTRRHRTDDSTAPDDVTTSAASLQYAVQGHPARLRVRAAGRRADPQLQDVGRLQPGLRGAGLRVGRGVLRAPQGARRGRCCPRPSWRSSWSARPSACILDRLPLPPPAHRVAAGQAGHLARPAGRHPPDRAAVHRRPRRKVNPPPLWPVKRADDFLWPQGGRFVLDASQIATLVATGVVVVGLVAPVPAGRARPADAGRGREPPAAPAAGRRRRAGVAGRRGSCRASWPAWPACSSPRCSPSSTRSTSSPCWSPPSPPASSATSPASRSRSLGGLGLGILQAELAGFLPTDSVLATGLRPVAAVRRAVRAAVRAPVAAHPASATRPTRWPASIPPPAAAGRRRCGRAWMTHAHPHLRRGRSSSVGLGAVHVGARRLLAGPGHRRRRAWR